MNKSIFIDELNTLEEAKRKASGDTVGEAERAEAFGELIVHYEKLLRTSMKLARISDIQGNMLKQREQEIRVANDNLGKLERARRDLITDISHELGTPLTSLQGYIEALMDGVIQADERYIRMMHGKVKLINQLISDLFELSKLKTSQLAFHMKELTVQDLVPPICRKYSSDLEKRGIRFVLEEPAREVAAASVHADPIRIEQVLANLLLNSVKYTLAGGTVTVRTVLDRPDLEPGGSKGAADWLVVQVTDTGSGIPEDDVPYVFNRFYQGHRDSSGQNHGSGLGLAISKEIIEQHGGQIDVVSQLGEGSTFFFMLPVVRLDTKREKEV